MNTVILDTDIVSEVLKQRSPAVIAKAAAYLRAYGQFTFSAFTRFEIIRGYKEKAASTQLGRFHAFCQHSVILPVTVRSSTGPVISGLWGDVVATPPAMRT